MARRLLAYALELNSWGRKACLSVSILAWLALAATGWAKTLTVEDMRAQSNECFKNVAKMISYCQPKQTTSIRKGEQLFKSPLPKVQEGPTVNNSWEPKFKANRYCAHHVYIEQYTCWLNIAIARAKEQIGRDIKVYYDANSVFIIHFRNPREATAALNILLQGENIELPPYWVEKDI